MAFKALNFLRLDNLVQETLLSNEELIMLVDKENREQGFRLRSLTSAHPFWIRASYVFVQVHQGECEETKFLIQERSKTKDYAPGCFMLSSGGVFAPNEGKLENALRELEEETGLSVDQSDRENKDSWQDAGWMNYVDENSRVWASLYLFNTDEQKISQELNLQEEEVEGVQFWTKDEILDRIDWQKKNMSQSSDGPQPGEIAPCSIAAFEHLQQMSYL